MFWGSHGIYCLDCNLAAATVLHADADVLEEHNLAIGLHVRILYFVCSIKFYELYS
jgi:hypothetical protein